MGSAVEQEKTLYMLFCGTALDKCWTVKAVMNAQGAVNRVTMFTKGHASHQHKYYIVNKYKSLCLCVCVCLDRG